MDGGTITLKTKLDTKQFDAQIAQLERKLEQMEKSYATYKVVDERDKEDMAQLAVAIEKTKNKLIQLRKEKERFSEPSGIKGLNTGINNFSNGLQKAVQRASKLALGIFGIRSAYMLLRRASSELASYDEQYATNLEYIRFALTQMIAPVLRYIVELAMKLLSLINSISVAWFGVNLFENASVDNFAKMKKGVGGVTSAVKELKKQLAGFDEMNILQENGQAESGGGGGGITLPEMNLSQLNEETESFVTKIKSMWEEAGAIYEKMFANPEIFDEAYGEWGKFMFGINEVWGGIYKFINGIIGVIKGVSQVVVGLLKGDKELISKGFENLINGIGDLLEGFLRFVKGIIDTVIGFVWGLIVTVAKWVYNNLIVPIANFFKWLWEQIVAGWHNFWNGLATGIDNAAVWVFDNILKPIGEFFGNLWDGIVRGAEAAWDGIVWAFNGITDFFGGIFNAIWGFVTNIATNVGNAIAGAFRAVINGVLSAIENILNFPIRAINGLIDVINNVPGIDLGYLNEFNLPRLKVGGIINMPNTGTLVGGSAIGGESGREGVVPLTDQQAMAELGREIGKNVLINLTNITSMNGRVINRELKQVQADQEFAYNM